MKVLVTGATGYIGGRLTPMLLDAGHEVRVLVRDASRIAGRPWAGSVEVAEGDLSQVRRLGIALEGIGAAYYLVHSMYGGADYARRDCEAAENFVWAAKRSPTLKHVVYLGGLVPTGRRVSQHLGSRAQVGRILREDLPATEFRAGPIIGSGSASFEMVRYLCERLPVIIAPIWIINQVQPIGVRAVLDYLVAALGREPMGAIDIGADRLSFKQMLVVFAQAQGFRRIVIPVPFLTPGLAARWIGLVTPIPNSLAIPLVEGMVEPVLADTSRARQLFPTIQPVPYREAVRRALEMTEQNRVQTRWSGALGPVGENEARRMGQALEVVARSQAQERIRHVSTEALESTETPEYAASTPRQAVVAKEPPGPSRPSTPTPLATHERSDREGLICDVQTFHVDFPPERVFQSVVTLGGGRGWLVWEWAWRARGVIDKLVGGPGLRRGRRHPVDLFPGEALDFWRVEAVETPRLVRLRAEMRVPGKAWLQWEVVPEDSGARLVQTAMFVPRGFLGALYWYSLYPMHQLIFRDMARAIAEDARRFDALQSTLVSTES